MGWLSEVVAHGRHAGGGGFFLDDRAVACFAGEAGHADAGAGRPVFIELVLPACARRVAVNARLGFVFAVAAACGLFGRDAEVGAVVIAAAAKRVGIEHELVAVAHRQG